MTISAFSDSSSVALGNKECEKLKQQFRVFKVESVVFTVNVAPVCRASATFRKIVLENADSTSPIVLCGHSARKFSSLVWALNAKSLPQPLGEKDLERLLDVEELAKRYSIDHLQLRAESTVLAMIAHGKSPSLLSCSSRSLQRMLKLALRVHDQALSLFLMQMWTWRLHSKELSYAHAIRLLQPARWGYDPQPFLKLLGHAYYAAMLEMEPKLSSGEHISLNSPLTRAEMVHVRCGYHSFRCWWNQVASKPSWYPHSLLCMYPERCSLAWETRFKSLVENDAFLFPKVDGIRRIQDMHKCLAGDLFLPQNMPEACRQNALRELQKRREDLLNTLYHHFDL